MFVGYMRVSKADGSQSVDLQRDVLLAAGIDDDQMYDDRASGKADDRPGLAACLKSLRDGDTLVVWKLVVQSRLRKLTHGILTSMLTIAKRKWSLTTRSCTTVFSWPVSHLGTDEHGSWLGARRGNPVLQADKRTEGQHHDAVWLITEDVWWLTAFWFTAKTDVTIDICTPPVFRDQTWSFVDLELDLFRDSDGHAGIVDQDEFDTLAVSGLLTEHEISMAISTARSLLPQLRAKTEPFGDRARSWLRGLGHGSAEESLIT